MRTERALAAIVLCAALIAALLAGCTKDSLPKPEEEGPPLESPAGTPEADVIVVPDVIGMTEDAATTDLAARGFAVAAETKPSDEVPQGEVMAQSLAPGTEVAKDTEIVLTVSAGPQLVEVPKVIGMYPEDAKAVLEAAGLEMKAVDIHGPIDPDAGNADIGEVYRQTPSAGSMVPKGTVVEVRSWWESG